MDLVVDLSIAKHIKSSVRDIKVNVNNIQGTYPNRFLLVLFIVVSAFGARFSLAQDHADEETFDPVHHVADGNQLDFTGGYAIQLPRLFVVRKADGSIVPKFFRSTASALASGEFEMHEEDSHAEPDASHEATDDHSGEEGAGDHAAEESGVDDDAGEEDHSVESESTTEDEGQEAAAAHAADSADDGGSHGEGVIAASHGDKILIDLSITRHLLFAWLVMLLLYLFTVGGAKKYKAGIGRETEPRGKSQNMLETFVLFVRDEIAEPNMGDKAGKFLPYLLTVFFFILGCNLIGLVPFSATATSNITVTAVLATFTFLVTQFSGTKDHWKHLAGPPGVPLFVRPLLIPVEILGLFTKPFALAIRLFANMTAGHIVILSLIGLIFTFTKAYGATVGWGTSVVWVAFTLFIFCLELLVAFLQAYIFTMLSALFIGMAVEEHDHDHEHEEAHA